MQELCEAILTARDNGGIKTEQEERYAKHAEILIRSFAKIGIIALVDEVTGYQDDRSREALQKILEKFIAKELHPWVRTFPDEFYKEYFCLHGWQYKSLDVKRPGIMGKDTNDLIYDRLAPSVLEELQKQTPTPRDKKGRLKNYLHRRLTDDIGHPKLKEHISNVIVLMRDMRASANWRNFKV